jgi:hypothetical protein
VIGCVMGKRLWIGARGSVRAAARRRMETERELLAPLSVDTDLQGLRWMDEVKAQWRCCGHVVVLILRRG